MASPPDSDVLLETLAASPHASPGTHSSRRAASPGDPARSESQRPLAHGQDHCQWGRDDERLVARARDVEPQITLGGTCSASPNRLVRTRLLGGVGRASRKGRPYPISHSYCVPSCRRIEPSTSDSISGFRPIINAK